MPDPAEPAPAPARRRAVKFLAAGTSLLLALLLALLLGEGALRVAGGYRLFTLRLQPRLGPPADAAGLLRLVDDIVAPFVARTGSGRRDLDPGWLETSPPPVPPHPGGDAPLLPQIQWLPCYYVVNEVLLRSLWQPGEGIAILKGVELPDHFTVFAPPHGLPHPIFRYPCSTTLPTGLTTNAFGFRGRELPVDKPAHTVRIAFVGASTTVEASRLPFSAPELIEHWLGLWAQARGLDVRFETLNAAREAIQSPDIRAIVQDEVLPLAVDYVVYYEGANQLQPKTVEKHVRVTGGYQLGVPPAGVVRDAEVDEPGCSAIAERLRLLLRGRAAVPEPGKPSQQLALPPGFDGPEFPLARAGEVLECGAIAGDLDAIRQAAAAQRAALVLCTFAWLAHDGLTTDPVLGHNIHLQLDLAYWPFRYATVRALADLQNRFFAAWAAAHGVDLIDVAGLLPQDERLYIDAIHHTDLGVRLKAWIMFVALSRRLERDLAQGAVPVPDTHPDAQHPNIGATRIVTRAELDAK